MHRPPIRKQMIDDLPPYTEERIRRPLSDADWIVRGSTPVVSFGDVRTAAVATLGWNPSKREFLDRAGSEFADEDRRLETLASLGVNALNDAPREAIVRVFRGCNTYFQRPSYYWWFNKLDGVLRGLGASYFIDPAGQRKLACHLDIVQDATSPVWGGLQRSAQERLIAKDLPFLRLQLEQGPIRVVLLNGRGLVDAYGKLLGSSPLLEIESLRRGRVKIFRGRGPRKLTAIGWNINLQTTRGVSNVELQQIGEAVRMAASE
jgi:hypothetical protein